MNRQPMKTFVVRIVMLMTASLFWTAPVIPAYANDRTASAVTAPDGDDEVLLREDDGWKEFSSPHGRLLRRELTIYPEAKPAMLDPVRLLPKDAEMRDANAAIWYLKAMGFFEQTAARQAIERFQLEQLQHMPINANFQAAPWSWLAAPPSELPIEEVEKYLAYTNFQREFLHRAARCRNFDLDRSIHEIKDVIGFLLPEIQALRQLGRNQSLRCRFAIAKSDFATARAIIGENFQLARQLSAEPFLVSTLIGSTIARSSFQDAVYLVGEPNSPNLYWAIADLPNPLVDPTRAIALETDVLFRQVPPLRKIGIVPLADIDWSEFLNEVVPMMGEECDLVKRFDSTGMLGAALFIASAGEEVDSYLLNECGVTVEQLDALPTTQAFFLAVRRMYESASQEAAQLFYAPESAKLSMIRTARERGSKIAEQYPVISDTIEWVFPRVARPAVEERWMLQQRLALLQTVEALRDHLAAHDSQWPQNLSDLALPAPHDPVTGEPFAWSVENEKATLAAASNGVERLEIILQIGKSQNPAPQAPIETPTFDKSRSKWQVVFQIDDQSTVSSIFPDRLLDRLSPEESSVWQAIQQTLRAASTDKSSGGGELLHELFPAFLANTEVSPNDKSGEEKPDANQSLRTALDSVAKFPVRWAVALPQSFRQVFAETHPTIDGGSHADQSLAWIENVKWAAVGVDTDHGAVKTIVQCQDGEAAKQVQDRLPHLVVTLYKHWVDPTAKEVLATGADLFSSKVTGDQVTFTAGGDGHDDDGLVSLMRLFSVGFQNSLAYRVQDKMWTLMLATHNYHQAFGRLPPFTQHADNTQRLGLSWRVYLLPFMGEGEGELFKKFHLDEPWDSKHNLKLVQEIPEVYQAPIGATVSNRDEGLTTLLAPASKTPPLLGGKNEHSFRQVIDGLAYTVAIVEVRPELAVPWTKPEDYEYDEQHPAAGLMVREGKTVIGTGDGWTGAMPIDMGDDLWRGIFTIDGLEPIGAEFERLQK